MRVYVSGPLHASRDLASARYLYELIAKCAERYGLDAYLPHLNTDPEDAADLSAGEVYRRDVRELLASDVVIAHVGEPSTGVGAEIALAIAAGSRVIAIHRRTESVSRFAEGLVLDGGGVLRAFDDELDLVALLGALFQQFVGGRDRLPATGSVADVSAATA